LTADPNSRSQPIIGTPGYMAPEQASGREATPATDVHGLGTLLYEMLTGRPPFQGETVLDTLERVRFREPVPPGSLRRIHRDIDTICLKCLQKEPGARYASALELAEDLRRFLNGEPIKARPVGPLERGWRWCQRNPARAALYALSAAALLGVVLGVTVHQARLGEAEERTARAQREFEVEQTIRKAAQREEAVQRYHALLHEVRRKQLSRPQEWTWTGLDRLRQACSLETPVRNVTDLRTEAAALLSGIDLRQQIILARDFRAGAIALHPDGKLLALGQFKALAWAASSVRLLELTEKMPPRSLVVLADPGWTASSGVQDGIRGLAFSRDGRWLLAGTRSGWVYRWDVARLDQKPTSWRAHEEAVEDILANGMKVVSCSHSTRQVRSWDVTGQPRLLSTYTAPQPPLFVCSTSCDGTVLACAREGGIDLLRAEDLKPEGRSLSTRGTNLAWSPDGQVLATEEDGNLLLIDRESGQPVRQLRDAMLSPAHGRGVTDMVFSPDGALLATGCHNEEDRKVKLWDVASGQQVASRVLPGMGPLCLTFTRDGRGLIAGCDAHVCRFEIGGREVCATMALHPGPVLAMGSSADGKRLACVSAHRDGAKLRGAVTLWDLDQGTRLAQRRIELPHREPGPASVTLGPERVAWSVPGNGGQLWDPLGSQPEQMLAEPAGILAWAPDGKKLWSAAGTRVRSWDMRALRLASDWSNFSTEGLPQINCLSVGRRWVLAGGRDGHVRLLRAEDGKLEKILPGPGGGLSAAAISPDETLAVIGTRRGLLRVLSVPAGETISSLADHDDTVESVAFDGTGRLLATGGRDRSIRLWSRQGTEFNRLVSLQSLPGPVKSLWISPDGSRLVVLLQKEAAVRIWRLDQLRQECARLGIVW
jgi:WD40 repeat protein